MKSDTSAIQAKILRIIIYIQQNSLNKIKMRRNSKGDHTKNLYLIRNQKGFSFHAINLKNLKGRYQEKRNKHSQSVYCQGLKTNHFKTIHSQENSQLRQPSKERNTHITLSLEKDQFKRNNIEKNAFQRQGQQMQTPKNCSHKKFVSHFPQISTSSNKKSKPPKNKKDNNSVFSQAIKMAEMANIALFSSRNVESDLQKQTSSRKTDKLSQFLQIQLLRVIEQENIGILGNMTNNKNFFDQKEKEDSEQRQKQGKGKIPQYSTLYNTKEEEEDSQQSSPQDKNEKKSNRNRQNLRKTVKEMQITALHLKQKVKKSQPYKNILKTKRKEQENRKYFFIHKFDEDKNEKEQGEVVQGWNTGNESPYFMDH